MRITFKSHSNQVNELARRTLEDNRVAIFIVAYNAERHIEKVLQRIPDWIAERLIEIFIIDDHSTDNTFSVAEKVDWPAQYAPLRIFRTPYNQGYGGNQRLGYLYAIERGFDIVILLHGDGQYAPEALPYILAPYAEGAEIVFGSRFINPRDAIRGGMPLYKWIGNRVLSRIQNAILGTQMSEMHSGYRSYRTRVLSQIPFTNNSLGFDFDADIIVQLHAAGISISEVPIPTFYGDEICHVNGLRYAWQCVKTAIKYRLMQFDIFYDPKFDIRRKPSGISRANKAPTSIHYFMRNLPLVPGSRLIEIGGANSQAASSALTERGIEVTHIDQWHIPSEPQLRQFSVDFDQPWEQQFDAEPFDIAIALNVLEHLRSPEKCVEEIFHHLKRGGKLYASTGNVAFFPLRIVLMLGWFNYGRGILDLAHRRLFTVSSFQRLLKNAGFRIDRVIGFGPPLADLAGDRLRIIMLIDRVLAWLARNWPGLFAFQILMVCTRTDSPADLMQQTFPHPVIVEQSIPKESNETNHQFENAQL
ncbi:MAG: bifunctional glycosyltransferase/class I SAM-dependent methyltransferase [Acidobacteria bacterium]|nr:bifunctional glycosyltransferase/class I SAM-dependent methyltransferase [Acidobacteriota bacterium]